MSFWGLQTQELITHARPRPEHVVCQLGDACFYASTHAVLCPPWEGGHSWYPVSQLTGWDVGC